MAKEITKSFFVGLLFVIHYTKRLSFVFPSKIRQRWEQSLGR